ncbi:patatin-like phospholipase family protein [Polyangium jinanense]|uniref:Patatin-like phospholipase family protein n=1 Tax=Polyangium jinanense TaxID=2829994 RepID=A0A9X3XF86_9BACT|nr:patatin-like phospholipase family protein [Polyangium jinanense]MDC3961410.1 patatin-like phospholipase family protein [Polyangium jinanense]MDC3987011.1 patatin-like phospholipase family protein [Polyangium jinanense]
MNDRTSGDHNEVYRRVPDEDRARCDLVMKGGITSGVVYPSAVLRLAKKRRFRCIGGASAGAIAAAAAAAAEYGRADGGGFARFERMQEDLDRQGFLMGLFQPTPQARPIFEMLLLTKRLRDQKRQNGEERRSPHPARRLFTEVRKSGIDSVCAACPGQGYTRGRRCGARMGALVSLAVVVPSAALFTMAVANELSWLPLLLGLSLCGVFLVSFAYLGGIVGTLLACLRHVHDDEGTSLFGLCTGSIDDGSRHDQVPLTEWMHEGLQEMAGLPYDRPLTVGMLHARGIHFKVVTSDLNVRQPRAVPEEELDGTLKKDRSFVFEENEMRRLFPESVVRFLVSVAPPHESAALPPGYHVFPMDEHMPVLVAMRMSLSFPVLLCAVPLYTVEESGELRRHWFSDGGIGINFPIHFFDSWFPRFPTFGINLREKAPRAKEGYHAPGDDVSLPEPRDGHSSSPTFREITDMKDFLWAVFELAQSFRDDSQAALPGYRERVAQVYLEKHEGGLNLDMNVETIDKLVEKGDTAARLFLERFDFPQHRWVRTVLLMSRMEIELGRLCKSFTTNGLRQALHDLLEQEQEAYRSDKPWYGSVSPAEDEWFHHAKARMDALVDLMARWSELQETWQKHHPTDEFFFAERKLSPAGKLRFTPEV